MNDRPLTTIARRLHAVRASSLVQNVLALVSGSIVAQLVFLLTAPVLTRLYGFADFGGLAIYNAWVMLLALLGGLRYEHAIIIAQSEETKHRAVALAFSLAFASSAIYLVCAVLIRYGFTDAGGLREVLGVLMLIPVGVLAANLGSILNQLTVRDGLFRTLAICAGMQAILGVAIQVGLGLAGVGNGLVIGALVASVAYAAALAFALRPARIFVGLRQNMEIRTLRKTAIEFANFPRYALGADTLALVTLSFTPVLVAYFFNPAVAGIFALAIRVVRLPLLVISTAIAGVLRKEGVDRLKQSGDLYPLYRKVVTGLFAVGVLPCAAALLFGPEIFAVVFGDQWSEAGRVVRVLSPGILVEFVAFPLATFFLITDSQKLAFRLQVAGTLLLFIAVGFGSQVLDDFLKTCVLISAAMVVVNLTSIGLAWRITRARRGPD
jgi:O-antigen/teichoic acid export membrane protein